LFVLSVVSLQASGAAITVQYYSSAYVSATTSFPVAQTGGAGDFDGDGSSDDYRTVIPFDDARQLPPDATAYAGPAFFGAARGIRIGSTTAQAIDAKILMTSQYDGINISYGQSAGNNLWLDGIVYFKTAPAQFKAGSSLQLARNNYWQGLVGRWLVREGSQFWVSEASWTDLSTSTTTPTQLTFASNDSDGNWAPYDPAANIEFDQTQTFVPKNFVNITAVGWIFDSDEVVNGGGYTHRFDNKYFKAVLETAPPPGGTVLSIR
jgi:hypothetical protein